jgi:hypothetical protein
MSTITINDRGEELLHPKQGKTSSEIVAAGVAPRAELVQHRARVPGSPDALLRSKTAAFALAVSITIALLRGVRAVVVAARIVRFLPRPTAEPSSHAWCAARGAALLAQEVSQLRLKLLGIRDELIDLRGERYEEVRRNRRNR